MFQKDEITKEIETIIGPSVRVDGNFKSEGNIVIEGMVNGSLKTEKNLKVGENAKVSANVSVANAKIAGEIRGNLRVKERLELTNTARVYGDVATKLLIVSEGAILHGKCMMVKEIPALPEEKPKGEEVSKTEKTKQLKK